MAKHKIDTNRAHYRIRHFYAREHEPKFLSLQGALANLEQRRLECDSSVYSELWDMRNETDGEMVGFFEDGAPCELTIKKPTTAKIR